MRHQWEHFFDFGFNGAHASILIVDWPLRLSHFCPVIDVEKAFSGLKILSSSDAAAHLEWRVPKDLPYLDGHFPGYPVVPAVGIVDASVEGLRRALKASRLDLRGIPGAKFLSPFTPGQRLLADCHRSTSGEWVIEWKDGESGKLAAHLELQIDADNATHT